MQYASHVNKFYRKLYNWQKLWL